MGKKTGQPMLIVHGGSTKFTHHFYYLVLEAYEGHYKSPKSHMC